MIKIERKPIILKSNAGMIAKADLRTQVGGVSRKVMAHRVEAFLSAKYAEGNYRQIWSEHYRKSFLPEKFVIELLKFLYSNELKITIE